MHDVGSHPRNSRFRMLRRELKTQAAMMLSGAVGKRTACSEARLLRHLPLPMISLPERFGILWSAKAGSMAITLWFLSRLGLLEEAHRYGKNPHNYRRQVLTKSDQYLDWVTHCDPKTLAWLRIIRDPYRRTVSSFRHVVRHGRADDEIQRSLHISIVDQGLSFEEFLDHLCTVDITACDIHYRQQWHPIEQHISLHTVVNIDQGGALVPMFERFEQEIGLPPLDPARRAAMLHCLETEKRRHHKDGAPSTGDSAKTRIMRTEARAEWPSNEAFLGAETRRRIEQIYAKDFVAYQNYV